MTFSTSTCAVITALYLYQHDVSTLQLLHLFGVWPVSIFDIVRGMLLVCILFAGPLYENGLVDGDWKGWVKLQGVHETLSSWIGYRNFVVVCASTSEPSSCADSDHRAPSAKRLSGAPLWCPSTSSPTSPRISLF